MKNTFRKAVSVILAVMMLVSLCTVAITSASAEEINLAEFGLYSGSSFCTEDGTVQSKFFVTDPTGTGETVIKMAYGTGRYNLRLADPADTSTAFVATKDTYYTITFDYLIDAVGTDTSDFGFQAFHGLSDCSGYGRKGITTKDKWGISDSFIGDGKWHSAALMFKADTPTASDGETLINGVYLTYYNSVGIDGYLKNITINTEGTSVSYGNATYSDFSSYFNEDGTANTDAADLKFTGGTTGFASVMADSYLDEDGNAVFVPTVDVITASGNSQQNSTSPDWVNIVDSDGDAVVGKNPNFFTITLKYKVLEIGESGYAAIAFGRAGATASQTIHFNRKKITAVSEDWQYFTASFYPNTAGATSYLRIAFSGIGSKIAIESVQVSYVARGTENLGVTLYNDNGEIYTRVQYDGTSIMLDGSNAENTAMGEKFMGWYNDPNYESVADVTPDTATVSTSTVSANSSSLSVVYARYPSTIIDFNHRTSYTKNYGHNVTSAVADNDAGTFTATGINTVGFMLPSYDADISDTTTAAFYQFKDGVKYNLTFVIDSNSTEFKPYYTCANFAGSAGARKTGSDTAHGKNDTIPVISETTTYSHELTFTLAAEGYNGICFRGQSTSVKTTIVIDKIIITEYSDEALDNMAATITIDDGVNEPTTQFAYVGDLIVMPEAPEKDGMMFVGWYDTSVNLEQVNSNGLNVSEDYIPVSAIRVTEDMQGTTTTYAAKYISTEAETIDFEEEYYQGNDRGGYAWSETPIKATTTDETTTYSAASNGDRAWPFTIQDDGNGDHYAYIDTLTVNETLGKAAGSNHWKIQLFHDDGSYIHVYEGVTYKITMKYEVVTASDETYDASKEIGISRAVAGGYMPRALDGTRQGQNRYGYANEDAVEAGVQEITKELRVENTYHAFSGDRSTGACVLSNALAVKVFSGVVKVYEVIVEPVSYTAPALHDIDLTKGSADIDYENGTITLTPNEGYEVSAAGVSAVQYYNDYSVDGTTVTIVENEVDYFNLMPTANGGSTDDGLTFKFDNNIEGAKLSSYRFMVDFVETNDSTVNAATIGFSVRTASGEGDTYESAGIRFRFRASAQTVANADKVEFVIVPTAALGESTIEAYMAADGSAAVTGVAKNDTKHVVYENVGTYYDYQAILTGLTNEDGRDLTDLQLSVAFRVTVGETVTYIELGKSVCYNDYFAN